jgi:Aspartyl protease
LEIKGQLYRPYDVYIIIAFFKSHAYSGPIEFVVDTGCSKTTINDKDAKRLGINYKQLDPTKDDYHGMGGTDVVFFSIPKCRLSFTDEEGKQYPEDLDTVLVSKHKSKSNRQKEIMATFPSLVGLDVLKNYKIHFTNFTVTLEL